MRIHLLFACTVTCVLMIAANRDAAQPLAPELPSGVIARVGVTEISAETVLARLHDFERHRPADDQHMRMAYEYIIHLTLLKNDAAALGVTVTEEDRRAVTKRQIELLRDEHRKRYGGAVTWEQWLQNEGYNETSYYNYIYERSEPMVLKKRVVRYYELTQPGAKYQFIRSGDLESALAIKARLDADKQEGKLDFAKASMLQNANPTDAGEKFVWKEEGLPDPVKKALFTELKPGEYSGVLTVADGRDYRIVSLTTRWEGQNKSYADTRSMIEATDDISPEMFNHWVALMQASGKYPILYRFPGEATRQMGKEDQPGSPR